MEHSNPSDRQSQAMTMPMQKPPPKKVQLTQQNVVCETEYAAPSIAVESMKQSVIASTVIQFEFNVKNDYGGPVEDSMAQSKKQMSKNALKAKKRAQNGATDFIEPEPLDLERVKCRGRAKARQSEFQVPEDPEVRRTRLMKKRKLHQEIENCESVN